MRRLGCSNAKVLIFLGMTLSLHGMTHNGVEFPRNDAAKRKFHEPCRTVAETAIGLEVNANHKRHLPPTFAFTDLPHHRTSGSAYGGFALSHLTMCGKLFQPSLGLASLLLYCRIPSYRGE